MTGIGISTAEHRTVVREDLLNATDVLEHFLNKDKDRITIMCALY